MRLNGALKPRQGAPTYGRSTGAKKYRDKQQERRCNNNNKINKRQRPCDWRMTALLLRNNNNNNKKSPIIIINNNSSSAQKEEENKMRNNIIQQIQQRNDKVTTVKISSNNIYNSTKINVKFCCRNNKEPATTQRQHQTQQQQQENIEFDYGICRAQRNAAEAVASDSSNNDNIVAISTTTTTTKMFLNVIGISSYELNSNNNERCFHRLTSSVQLLLLPLITLLPPVLVATLICCCVQFFKRLSVTAVKMVRVQQSLMRTTKKSNRIPEIQATAGDGGHGGRGLAFGVLCVFSALALLPHPVACDDGDFFGVNSFSMGPETTTPEFGYHFAFDYASRGQKKFGDKCENTLECGFPGSICDPKKKSCQCTEDLPVTNHIDKCGKEAAVNESCFFNEQCEVKYFQTECRDGRCVCRFEMSPIWGKDGSVECKGRQDKRGPETYIDPAMIGVLVGMALMFIIICVVLRLFSQARWRENRTIFNTPNPRLMNVSLLRDSKLLHGQERRGSRMSVRAPSRQPSMASLRPHSPNPSLGKTGRSMTRSKSNTRSSDSRVSDASNCSRLLEHHPITTAMQHSTHPHTHSHPHTHAHNALPSTSAANINNINHATTTTYIATSPGAGSACGTPSPPAAPTVAIKANKF